MAIWNPWHGCKKYSPGCLNCYVYRRDESIGKDAGVIERTKSFDLPLKKDRKGAWKLQPEEEPVYTCMTSDFFVEEADAWRPEAWRIIKTRSDLQFVIITKRIVRFMQCIPPDWGDGYENVSIMCTCENQRTADERLPVLLDAPIRHRSVIHEPMLEEIHIEPYLESGKIREVVCGGESGNNARLCDYDWILSTRRQCMQYGVRFHFMQTGALFRKDGRIYHIARKDQLTQASRAGIDYAGGILEENSNANGACQNLQECNLERDFHLDEEPQEAVSGCVDAAYLNRLFARLSASKFRSSFSLKPRDFEYIGEKGMDTIRRHAGEMIAKRLAPAVIPNDGKQTPMRGHPVFIAQHATACCCRGCLAKWHHIPQGRALTEAEQRYVVTVLTEWIERQMRHRNRRKEET